MKKTQTKEEGGPPTRARPRRPAPRRDHYEQHPSHRLHRHHLLYAIKRGIILKKIIRKSGDLSPLPCLPLPSSLFPPKLAPD